MSVVDHEQEKSKTVAEGAEAEGAVPFVDEGKDPSEEGTKAEGAVELGDDEFEEDEVEEAKMRKFMEAKKKARERTIEVITLSSDESSESGSDAEDSDGDPKANKRNADLSGPSSKNAKITGAR